MNAHSRLSLTAALRSRDEIETVKSQGCPRSTTHRSVVLAAAPGDGQPWYEGDDRPSLRMTMPFIRPIV